MKSYFFYTDQLTVGYDGKPLIKEINIQLNKGEILTLIGPNGAGKSTILKSITRQLSLISGTVYLEQEQMSRMTNREVSKKLAVVLTERMRPELMTCEDVVSTGRYPYTGTLGILSAEDKEKVKSAMEMVHAWDLKDRDFTAISDGQRQRILLARAICQEPEIIILDEPTSFLDIRHKLELLAILKKMVLEKQMTVIMSLHELDLAQKISDQVICVHGDHIEKYGAPEEIFTSDYIRKLYGITRGSYNAEFGCVEMEPPAGKPEVFVIGGNGSGIPVYRKLQRQGIPFVTGVLHTNDADYQVAKELAAKVITEKPFECISESAFEEALEFTELGPLRTRLVHTLSGGERQRAWLAMALAQKPKLLLLDEHTAALDPKTALKVLTLSARIVEENHLTTMMITHNMKDAIKYGNRLIMMHEGHIIYDVAGEEKQKLHVSDLLAKFQIASGGEFANDRMILSN